MLSQHSERHHVEPHRPCCSELRLWVTKHRKHEWRLNSTWRHFSVVMSAIIDLQLGIGMIGTKSTPITRLPTGISFAATCIQPPGAAQRSIRTLDEARKLNRRFNWISLKADLALNPAKYVYGNRHNLFLWQGSKTYPSDSSHAWSSYPYLRHAKNTREAALYMRSKTRRWRGSSRTTLLG